MKNTMTLRQRGYDLLQISLGIAIVLGLMVGGLMLFNQVQTSSELSEKTRTAVSVSSEVRAQYRTEVDFSDLTTDAADPIADSTFATRSGMPDAMFANLTIAPGSDAQEFVLNFANLNETVCERMAIADLGPNSDPVCTVTDGVGALAVTYSR